MKAATEKATKAMVDFINSYIKEIDSLATWGLVNGPSGDSGAAKAGAKAGFIAMFAIPGGEEEEAARLLSGWSKGTFETLGKSILYHFGEHGEEVGAKDVLTYLRKAEGFASNLKRARTFALEEGATRYEKNGRYLIKDAEGLIRSFGAVRDPI